MRPSYPLNGTHMLLRRQFYIETALRYFTLYFFISPTDARGRSSIKIQDHPKSDCGDKTILWPHYLQNGNSYSDKTIHIEQTLCPPPGVGVTKAPFVNFSVSEIFDHAKVPVRFLESHSYLTAVTAAELRWHLPNINVIFNYKCLFWQWWKIGKITERGKLA